MSKKYGQVGFISKEAQITEDRDVMTKVRQIVQAGLNAEIKVGNDGKLKVYKVKKEIT